MGKTDAIKIISLNRKAKFNYQFWDFDMTPYGHKIPMRPMNILGFITITLYTTISMYAALHFSNWLKKVKR